ncbi:MAG TPA: hypothetical protein DDW50_15835 [Firmicutes bacterium]|jgi:DNA-binding MarR family transcriptional regulator|nr:hypothetical protein [Bacillota bacterium]
MKDEMVHCLMNEFIKISYKLNELEKVPIDFGTGELLYPSEIHTIDAVGDQYDTVTAISQNFGITKGAVSQVIFKLHQRGYVQKVRNEAYNKEILLSLTDKGLIAYRTHKELHKTMDGEIIRLMGSYSDEWLQTFENMLLQLEKQVDKFIDLGKKN